VVALALWALLEAGVGGVVDALVAEIAALRTAVALAPVMPPANEEDAVAVAAPELECGFPVVHSSSRMDENWTPTATTCTLLAFGRSSIPRAQAAT
jgi:hypothetical protein